MGSDFDAFCQALGFGVTSLRQTLFVAACNGQPVTAYLLQVADWLETDLARGVKAVLELIAAYPAGIPRVIDHDRFAADILEDLVRRPDDSLDRVVLSGVAAYTEQSLSGTE